MRRHTIGTLVLAALLGLPMARPTLAEEKQEQGDLRKQKHLIEVGLYLGAFFPSKRHELYVGTEHKKLELAAFDIGLRLAYLPIPNLGIELEGGLMPTKTRQGDSALLWTFRGHVIVQFPLLKRLAPFIVIGGGPIGVSSKSDVLGKDHDAAFHYGAGLKCYVTDWMNLRVDFRHIVSARNVDQDVTSHFEALAGLSLVFGWTNPPPVHDRDGDGVPDEQDKCPDVAAKTPDGCPPDKDGDGVIDEKDKCPDVPANTVDGCPPDRDGDGVIDEKDKCPDVAAKTEDGCPPDRDGDGVIDEKDKCPDVPAKTEDGCPPDRDGDGVIDEKDKCPDEAAKTPDGCPPDTDGDGIPDYMDKCPDKPETKNGYQDEDGCPDVIPAALKRFTGAIQGINFAYNKADITKASYPLLNRAATVLKQYPDTRIMIRGHTDDRGKRDFNMKLSLDRAQAVKDYLTGHGIDAKRIEVEGLGPDEPVGNNKTFAGRAKNRRIEFKLIMSK